MKPLKPRLTYCQFVWTCRSVCRLGLRVGYGYTPKVAYDEWKTNPLWRQL